MDFVRAFDERPNACAVPIQTLISPAKIESIDAEVHVRKQSRHKTGFFISLLSCLPPTQARIIDLEADWRRILEEQLQNPIEMAQGHHVSYVMYTSGSTGTPKGVVVLHRGVCNYLLWRKSYFPLNATDRVLQKTSFSFVDSVWELFEPLMVGAQLIMAEPGRHYDPAYLVNFIIEQKITAVDFIPSLLQLFLEEPNVAQCTTIRRVTTGSETVTMDLQSEFFANFQAGLYNLYGPTEASIASTCWTCRPDDDKRSVPIGRPIDNTQIYLLDKKLQPVPSGLPGEVHIGGLGLARGYLNRPELTAEKFISNPFSDDPEARLYKTGDLACYLPDGNLKFLGRADHQVKIRGYRIELGEIEAFLRQHSAVQKAVAMVREDRPNDKRLVVYVVPDAKQDIKVGHLRHYLKQKLPDYMVPSAFISLDALPMTPNGKVDRGVLPMPDATRPELPKFFVAPEGPIEERLAEMWQEVLGLNKVGVHDDFFELGGHSLIAARLFSKIERAFGRQLPLATLFHAPTIAQISTIIEQAGSEAREVEPIRRLASREGAELSFAQQRLWFLDQYEPGSGLYNIPAAVRLKGELDEKGLEWALAEIIRRHEALRTRFESVDGEPVQRIAEKVEFQLPVRDLTQMEGAEEEVAELVNEQARHAFDLSRDLMLRAQLIKVSDREHVLAVVLHHIASDGWSMGVLFKELSHLYQCYVKGESSSLPELEIQYADYAVWQREWLTGEELDKQVGYWQKQLEAAPPLLQLPTDHPRPAVQSHRGRQQSFELTQELTAGLKQLSRRQGTTLYMTLLAAFKVLLYR